MCTIEASGDVVPCSCSYLGSILGLASFVLPYYFATLCRDVCCYYLVRTAVCTPTLRHVGCSFAQLQSWHVNASCMLQATFNDWIGSPPHTALQVGAAFDLGCCSMAHAWCMMPAPLVLLLIPCGQHNQLRSWMCKHTRVSLDGTSTAFQKWQCRQAEQAKRTHSNCVHAEHRSVSTVTYVALPSGGVIICGCS